MLKIILSIPQEITNLQLDDHISLDNATLAFLCIKHRESIIKYVDSVFMSMGICNDFELLEESRYIKSFIKDELSCTISGFIDFRNYFIAHMDASVGCINKYKIDQVLSKRQHLEIILKE